MTDERWGQGKAQFSQESVYFQIVGTFTDPGLCPNLQFKPKMFFFQVFECSGGTTLQHYFSPFRPAEGGRSWSPLTHFSPRGPPGTRGAPTRPTSTATSSLPAPPSRTSWPSAPPWMEVSLSAISARQTEPLSLVQISSEEFLTPVCHKDTPQGTLPFALSLWHKGGFHPQKRYITYKGSLM